MEGAAVAELAPGRRDRRRTRRRTARARRPASGSSRRSSASARFVVRPGPHRRAARPDRPLHLLAAPRRARRRGARARARPSTPCSSSTSAISPSWIVRATADGSAERSTRRASRCASATCSTSAVRVSGRDARLTWVPSERLLAEAGVEEWMGVPLWLARPAGTPCIQQASVERRRVAAGLTFRPLADTILGDARRGRACRRRRPHSRAGARAAQALDRAGRERRRPSRTSGRRGGCGPGRRRGGRRGRPSAAGRGRCRRPDGASARASPQRRSPRAPRRPGALARRLGPLPPSTKARTLSSTAAR